MAEEDVVAWDFAKKARGDAAIHQRMASRVSTAGGASDPAAIGYHGHRDQFRDVLAAILEDRPPAIDGHEGRRSVENYSGPSIRPRKPAGQSNCRWRRIPCWRRAKNRSRTVHAIRCV